MGMIPFMPSCTLGFFMNPMFVDLCNKSCQIISAVVTRRQYFVFQRDVGKAREAILSAVSTTYGTRSV